MDEDCLKLGNIRLLALADFLDMAIPYTDGNYRETGFTMDLWSWLPSEGNPCGSPGCALGHYAVMEEPASRGWTIRGGTVTGPSGYVGKVQAAMTEFCLETAHEFNELFSSDGCGRAKDDPKKAAAYIRAFVARRTPPEPVKLPEFDEAKFREIMECDANTAAINAMSAMKRKREIAGQPEPQDEKPLVIDPVSETAESVRERVTV